MARLAREFRSRPLLRDAVLRGEVSARKAQAVLGRRDARARGQAPPHGAPKWQRLEAMCEEYLGSHLYALPEALR